MVGKKAYLLVVQLGIYWAVYLVALMAEMWVDSKAGLLDERLVDLMAEQMVA